MKPGTYIATIIDAGMKTNYKEDLVPFLTFKTEDGSQISWEGNLSTQKGEEYAAKTLVAVGFIGRNWEDVAIGMPKFAPQPVSIEVEEVTSEKTGKKFLKVKWINGIKAVKRVTSTEVKAKMAGKDTFAKFLPKQKEDAGF